MPPMVICCKRLGVATDDFVILYGLSVITRPIWLVLVGLTLCFYERSEKCRDENILKGYLIILEVLHSVLFILELMIVYISSRGTIAKPKPRRFLPFFFGLQLLVFMIKFSWDIAGVLWAFNPYLECSSMHQVLMVTRGILLWNLCVSTVHGFIFLIVIGLYQCLFCCCLCGKRKAMAELERSKEKHLIKTYHQRTWKRRLRCLCCALRGPYDSEVYEEISEILEDSLSYFREYTFSDILAGIALCATNSQKVQYDSTRTRKEMHLSKKTVRNNYDNVVLYAKFAVATYGGRNCDSKGIFCLPTCLACINCSGSIPCPLHTGCCTSLLKSIADSAEIDIGDIKYISPVTQLFCPAFYVAYDHKRKAVVVAIRGMLSIKDVITFLHAVPSELENVSIKNRDKIAYGHKGMMSAAIAIWDILLDKHILVEAFQSHRDYSLVVCGHSTGGGIAALLALMLKASHKDVHCYAYAPPGSVLNGSALRHSRDTVTTVVFQNDIISRLTLESFDQLRTKIMSRLETSRLPKYKIILSSFYHWMGCCKCCIPGIARRRSVTDVLIDKELSPNVDFDAGQFLDVITDSRKLNPEDPITGKRRTPINNPVPLYLPGKIIHITERSRHWFAKTQYQAHYTAQDEFSKIVLERNMLSSHLPYRCLKIVLALQKQQY